MVGGSRVSAGLLLASSGRLRITGWLRLPSRFRGLKVPETLPYPCDPSSPTDTPPHHAIHKAASAAYSYVLELSRDPGQLAPARCRVIQVSPHTPAASPRPHQPTRVAHVRPFRAGRGRDSHPLSRLHRSRGHCLPRAVSSSPNPPPSTGVDWVEGGIAPPAPVVAAPAPLRARGFGSPPPWQGGGGKSGAGGPRQ